MSIFASSKQTKNDYFIHFKDIIMMKTTHVIALFGAMVTVSAMTAFGTYKLMEPKNAMALYDDCQYEQDSNLQRVNFAPAVSRGSVTDNDFTVAAESTVNAVVGVKNTQMVQQQYQQMDPFFDFFFGNRGQQQQPRAREGFGSGVIISSDGYIVTNNHVIDGADQLTVTLNDNTEYEATLVGTDPTTDIALLKIEAKDLHYLTFGNSDDLKIGQWVLAVGNPFMLSSTVTAGIVSAKGRRLSDQNRQSQMGRGSHLNIENFIQTDAAVNPGNSGGALVNTAGELVGINTAIYSQTGSYAGYSFAVPSSIASKVVADLRQYGQVQKAVLGIQVQDVNEILAEQKGLKVKDGVYVAELVDGGAAIEAGIKQGDVLVAIGKNQIKNFPALQAELALHTPGEKVEVTVNRDGKEKTYTVTLKNAQGSTEKITKKGMDMLGVTLQNLSAQELQKYGVRKGVLVKDVKQGGSFARAGVHEKFLIVKINDVVVNSDKEVEKVFEQLTTNRDADQEPVMFIVGIYPNGRTAYYAVDLSK